VGEVVHWHIKRRVATITLDSPVNRNALSKRLLHELHDALDAADAARARVVVVTHTDPAFCSGADLKERANGPVDSSPMVRAMQRLRDGAAPTIAAVRGPVRAGGIGLMASCDLVVVAPSVSFQFTEVRLGLAPAIISVPILQRCAWSHLAAAFLTGEEFDARRAEHLGLVTHVAADVDGKVAELVAALLAGAPHALAITKSLLRAEPNWDAMRRLSESLFSSEEAAEGMRAFREGRTPSWNA
jgi:enoyl-CoA hydratase/carnithine racemase